VCYRVVQLDNCLDDDRLEVLDVRRLARKQGLQQIALQVCEPRLDRDRGSCEELWVVAMQQALIGSPKPLRLDIEREKNRWSSIRVVRVEMRFPGVNQQGVMVRERMFTAPDTECDVRAADLEDDMADPVSMDRHRLVESQQHDPTERAMNNSQRL
jgi:hypothetical protein